MRLLVLTLAALALLPATAAAQAPDADTGAAADVTATTATLTAVVAPRGEDTTYRFEYGTSVAYGLQTPAREAGDGSAGVEVREPVLELSPATTYHYRVVAENASGEALGQDMTFTTAPNPAIPRAFGLRVAQNSPTDPVVRATINPEGSATSWHVEYGHTTAFLVTPDQELPAGIADVPVTATLTGLEPSRRVFWRVVATNAAGIRRSGRRHFSTLRAPTGVAFALVPATVRWGRPLTVRGQVQGSGVAGITVALRREAFPFGVGLADAGTTQADTAGGFAFEVGPLLVTTRFQVETRSPIVAQSGVLTAYSALNVGAGVERRTRRSVVLAGRVRPAVASGRAALQRRGPDGRWRTVRRSRLVDLASFSRYRFAVLRLRRAQRYRVSVSAHDGGAHVPGVSRSIRVAAR
jgi:hypothetical protein